MSERGVCGEAADPWVSGQAMDTHRQVNIGARKRQNTGWREERAGPTVEVPHLIFAAPHLQELLVNLLDGLLELRELRCHGVEIGLLGDGVPVLYSPTMFEVEGCR